MKEYIKYKLDGKEYTMSELMKKYGFKHRITLYNRIHRYGVEKAVNKNFRFRKQELKYNGEKISIADLAKKYNINYNLLYARIIRGKRTVEKALKTKSTRGNRVT